MKRNIVGSLVLFIAQLLVFESAQAFPDRPIKLVGPSPAGGPPDIMARLLSDKMGAALGQPVIVENRPGGAGGTIGAKSVVTAEPDGHTILMGSTSALLIAFGPQERWIQFGNICARCRSFVNHRSPGRASICIGQLCRRSRPIGEVAAGHAEVRFCWGGHASAY